MENLENYLKANTDAKRIINETEQVVSASPSKPTYYKNIQMSLDEYSVNVTAINSYIKHLQSLEIELLNQLNGSDTTAEVSNNQSMIKYCREQIKDLKNLIKIMGESELITKHTL